MNIIGDLTNNENGFLYDVSTGRLWRKEITWECEKSESELESKCNSHTTPYWFQEWANNNRLQQAEQQTAPKWFLDWLNQVNFKTPTPTPSTTTTISSTDMPSWFKNWLSTQKPRYPYQSQPLQPQYPPAQYPPAQYPNLPPQYPPAQYPTLSPQPQYTIPQIIPNTTLPLFK